MPSAPDGRWPDAVRVAFLGCGYVADYYATTLANHPELQLVGVHDSNAERARRFAASRAVDRVYAGFQDLLDDDAVDLVLNLTDVASHHETTRACLLAGKHVYSEKPLATTFDQSEALVQLAEERGLSLSAAPCSLLGEAAQTTWKALRDGLPGDVRLVYAELDEGPIVRYDFRTWTSRSGVPLPFADEFETRGGARARGLRRLVARGVLRAREARHGVRVGPRARQGARAAA